MSDFNEAVIDEYRATGGNLSGPLAGQQVLLLTHKGARTGTISCANRPDDCARPARCWLRQANASWSARVT